MASTSMMRDTPRPPRRLTKVAADKHFSDTASPQFEPRPGSNPNQYEDVSMSPKKETQKSAKSTTAIGKTSKGFTDEERLAMRERVHELKAADGENAVLAQIGKMPEPERAMGKRLHAIIKASAPALSPRLWYGMPAYAKDGKVVCFFQSAQKFNTR